VIRRLAGALLAILGLAALRASAGGTPETMDAAHPGLVTGVLAKSALGELPKGVVVRAGDIEVAAQAIEDLIAKSPKAVRAQLRKNTLFLLEELVAERLRLAGGKKPDGITLSAAWAKEAAALARDNPVDKARLSGKPSVVDFGASGCVPCKKMAPILKTLAKTYDGRANVVFVHVDQEPILTARYRVTEIPVQAFFDKEGREIHRHLGFLPEKEIVKRLKEMGVE